MKAKIWNKKTWIKATDERYLSAEFLQALRDAGFTVLSSASAQFKPYGFTILFLLAESHFAIHTFPESGKSYIELSSCNQKYFNKFWDICLQRGLIKAFDIFASPADDC